MADKEATVYIIDVGKSMGRRRHGRPTSDLEWAMRYIWDKITTTVGLPIDWEYPAFGLMSCQVATGRKTATVGVLGLRTDGQGYSGISWTSMLTDFHRHCERTAGR